MKKVISFALVAMLVLSAASFAQTKKAAPVASSSGMMIGIDTGLTSLKFDNKDFSASVGASFTSAGGTSTIGFGGNYRYKLSKGAITTNVGGGASYQDLGGGFSTITLRALYGAETTIAGKLNVGFDVFPVSFSSTSGGGSSTTSFGLGGGTVYAYLEL